MRRLLKFFSGSEIAANHTADRVEEVFATLTITETLKSMAIAATCLTLVPVMVLIMSASDMQA
jgi:hypothetical protein